ncbi:DHS-like NAD/FAD-binding domain-containing protein [Apiosordaria backusii]|uniref:DHS-like NAD/FAD-binding domain-containing protein n=1 Tax=Apiosordaria backusii TaxID=314023 RepID=A0AA40EN64_9PEZI|nr:DHS-like NAD/FAD-binding domain-containing protein [Apiosordaria backusii]
MASASRAALSSIPLFHEKLLKSNRILAVCGAGLSAASGLPTFRGAGGLWRNHNAVDLASPDAFEADPGLVWLFYAYRRHMALKAKPNPAHHALAELARKIPGFKCLSQNVDNLHVRAQHPPNQLSLLHGSLFSLKCSESPQCSWTDPLNTADPLCPALAPASEDSVDPTKPLPLLDPSKPLADIPASELPHCPECKTGLVRPGVVWFGEMLDEGMLDEIDGWIEKEVVDMVLVIGTSSFVYPAAGYAERARTKGRTSVVTVNLEITEKDWGRMKEGDFGFEGDAAVLLPVLLGPVIGTLEVPQGDA